MRDRERRPDASPRDAGADAAPGSGADAALDAAERAARGVRDRLEALPPLADRPPRVVPAVEPVTAGRFATLGELRDVSAALAGLPGVGDVHLTSFWSGWAELELALAAPFAGAREQALAEALQALAPAGSLVRRAPGTGLVVELPPPEPPPAIALDGDRRPPRPRPRELAAGGDGSVQARDAADREDALALALGRGLAFWSLRGVRPDRAPLAVLPLAAAERELVLPLVLTPGWLTIAAARPDPDLPELAARFPDLRVEVVVAARAELAEALALLR